MLARQDQLGCRQREGTGHPGFGVPPRNPGQRGRLAASNVALQLAGPFAELFEIRVLGQRGRRHRKLLSLYRPVRDAGRKEGREL